MQRAGTARPSLTLDCLENFEALNEAAANEEEKEELLYWYSSNTDNIDKVYAVEKLFRKLNVNRKLSTLIREYTNKAHSYLDQIDVPEERKSYLRELSEVLIDRQG